MSTLQVPTIFESFNARALKPSDVARTFVPSAQYMRLVMHRHTIIVGPRGSGKTTLLKMLQQPALESWEHTIAEECRSRVNFTGVFIATDVSWGAQINSLGDGKLDPDTHKLLAVAAFTTHVLRSLVIAMLHRKNNSKAKVVSHPFRRVDLSNEQEASLVRVLCDSWHIEPLILSLLSIKQALSQRLSKIYEIANREAEMGGAGREGRLGDILFLYLHFIKAASVAIEYFDDIVGEPDSKWALLFDELELAPRWIQDELIRSLRSTDERFFFKLALSPISGSAYLMENALSAAPDQDFEQLPLWYAEKRDSYSFCEELWYALLREREMEPKSPKSVLGISYFETPRSEWMEHGTAYSPGSRLARRFLALARKDRSFREYLKRKNIDPHKIHTLTSDSRAADVRKVAPLIPVREFYRAPDLRQGETSKARSRKSASLYAGADSLFAISEGNPRWFIAIVGRLLDRWVDKSKQIDALVQSDELLKAAQRFSAMLRTIPSPPLESFSFQSLSAILHKRGLLALINKVGRFFHDKVVKEDFMPEPPGTFIVDPNITDDIVFSLEQALNAGAIVYVPDDPGQILLKSLRSKRFRISYLLAPLHGLPLRLGRETMLSTILYGEDKIEKKAINIPQLPFSEGDSR
jgi:hypothetical protein